MFRYERPQKGRLRQFHQIGVEAFGTATPENDAEIIALSTDLLQKLGFTGLSVKLNTLGDPTDRKKYNAILRERIKRITGQARTTNPGRVGTESASWCDDWDRLADLNPMRVFDTKDPQARPHLQALPRIHDHVGPEARAHHEALCLALDQLGITYEQDADLVRGLDYYSRTVFEVIQGNIGAPSTILGGGRYDGLVAELGGPAVPGVGMAIGLERLILSMEAGGHLPPDDMIMPTPDDIVLCFDTAGLAIGFQLAQEGRRRGRRVLFDALARKPKAALREASRSRARRALILGDGELQRGTVQLKDLESGSQVEVPLSEAFPLS
jgi:histidyl-tRNA synthetase